MQRIARFLTGLALTRPVAVLACGLAIAIAGIALASRLALQTDLAELLPPDAPSVTALRALGERVGGTGNVAIAIESDDGKPDALRAYVPILVDALRKQMGSSLLSLKYSRKDVADYYKKFAAYYVSLDDLVGWSHRVAVAIAKQNPAYVELDNDTDPIKSLAKDVRDAKTRLQPKNKADDQTGLLIGEDGRIAVVFVRPAADSLDLGGSGGVLDRIQQIVTSTQPDTHKIGRAHV